ncbi:WASP homolog-associated protein with actin, membranes and microtubules [Pteronotus mesoamericanus]|uniref:WASP homolog-associated protein with actin, membranes and microtubules n=1 Tax=Pteronotus mesoamericanus TaxID=1884717 RepID=UPI0023ED9A6B|nr:WASP homolog-associated protein with actin, membranes and microtubules [Pteronotus parnellii mesoamericanus]
MGYGRDDSQEKNVAARTGRSRGWGYEEAGPLTAGAMGDEQPDSLEGWVPVREDLFAEPERHQLRFLVAWNDAEGKFAVTCHDRTAQRQRRREGNRPGSPPSWAGLLSAAGLRGAHRQLAALWPPLEHCFPSLPQELETGGGAWRLWELVWPARASLGEGEMQELCMRLERYLGLAAEGCGGAAVREALFPADGGAPDCESPRAFRERALRARLAEADARLRQILQGRERANTMVALMEVYREEDEAYQEFVTVATMFFQYLLQPFRDMREYATSCKLDILKSLEEDDLGPKRIVALQKEAQEWTRQAEDAIVSIQDITVNYFKETVKALAGMQKQMEQDERRFGQAAWATAAPRLDRLKLMLARETLQLMRAKELCLNRKRAEIQGKMEDLPEQEKNINVVDELEIQFYEVQLELYDVKFEILKYEEILLTTQLDSIKRLIKDKQDEVVYYDPCESPEELSVLDRTAGLQGQSAETEELSRQCRQLEHRRGRVCARRACLRSRKDQCKENHRLRLQQAEESVRYFHQHHSIQMKRDKLKEEEQKKKEWINQERQKTLQRLRAFKERCPGRSVRKSPRSAEPEAPHPPGELPQQASWPTSQTEAVIPPSFKKTRSAPLSEVSNVQPPKFQDCPGNIPVQIFVQGGDQTHSKASGELSLPPPPPPLPPPPPPPPPPPAPPLPPASPSSSLSANHRNLNLHIRTSVNDDQPLPLVCESPAERPHDSSDGFKCPASGSMDEVLASLRHRRAPVPKAEAPAMAPPRSSVNENILAAIRQGVTLKKVRPNLGLSPSSKPTSDLERSIKAALQRIKKVSADSEEEEEDGQSEWDH